MTALEPKAQPDRAKVLAQLIARRGYSRAELQHAMREVPFRNSYGEGVRLDLIEDAVKESRADRRTVAGLVSEAEVARLCDAYPELDVLDFHVQTYDERNRPLYRYLPGLGPSAVPPMPEPDDAQASPGVTPARRAAAKSSTPPPGEDGALGGDWEAWKAWLGTAFGSLPEHLADRCRAEFVRGRAEAAAAIRKRAIRNP